MPLFSVRLVLADTAQAQPLRRLFGRGYSYNSNTTYGYPYADYSGYGYPVNNNSGVVASNNCCCDSGATNGQVMYYPSTSYGVGRFRSGYGASMYFPTQTFGYAYAQPMPYATGGGVYQAGYPQGYPSGAIPAGGIVPGLLPTRPAIGTSTDTDPSAAKKVTITDDAFEPADMNIKVGSIVKWTNDDKNPHTVTSNKGDWGSEELAKGQSFTATFTKAGTFEYHCKLHPEMKGKITVK